MTNLPKDVYLSVCSLVAAAAAQPDKMCDMCGSMSHLVATCPTLQKVASDHNKLHCVLQVLQPSGASSRGGYNSTSRTPRSSSSTFSRASTAQHGNTSLPIRELQQEDTDKDISAHGLTDNEGSLSD